MFRLITDLRKYKPCSFCLRLNDFRSNFQSGCERKGITLYRTVFYMCLLIHHHPCKTITTTHNCKQNVILKKCFIQNYSLAIIPYLYTSSKHELAHYSHQKLRDLICRLIILDEVSNPYLLTDHCFIGINIFLKSGIRL